MEKQNVSLNRLKRLFKYAWLWLKIYFCHELKEDELNALLDFDKSGKLMKFYLSKRRRVSDDVFNRFFEMENFEDLLNDYVTFAFCSVKNEKILECKNLPELLKSGKLYFSDELQVKTLERQDAEYLANSAIDGGYLFCSSAEVKLMSLSDNIIEKYLKYLGGRHSVNLYPEAQVALIRRNNNEKLFSLFCKNKKLDNDVVNEIFKRKNATRLLMICFKHGYLLDSEKMIQLMKLVRSSDFWPTVQYLMQHGTLSDDLQMALYKSAYRRMFLDEFLSTGKRLSDKIQMKLFEEPDAEILLRRYIKNAGGDKLCEPATIRLFTLLNPEKLVIRFLTSGGKLLPAQQLDALRMRGCEIPKLLVKQELCDMALMQLMNDYNGEELFDAYRQKFPISANIRKSAISRGWM